MIEGTEKISIAPWNGPWTAIASNRNDAAGVYKFFLKTHIILGPGFDLLTQVQGIICAAVYNGDTPDMGLYIEIEVLQGFGYRESGGRAILDSSHELYKQ